MKFNTQGEPRASDCASYDAEAGRTPYELVVLDNTDLRARLQLADERAFYQAAEIARLRARGDQVQNLISACADMLVCIRDNPDFHAEQRSAARALMDYGVVRVCNQDLSVDAKAGL